tara:strand:- start:185 stop:979 length:795 start_codon:yes stop_codon:yes gene_type:complete
MPDIRYPWNGNTPILSWDLEGGSISTPEAWLSYTKKPSKRDSLFTNIPCLMTFTDDYFQMAKTMTATHDEALLGQWNGNSLMVANLGVGGPVAASNLEQLIAGGGHLFIAVGIAGGICDKLQVGDLIVPDRALREEGTSYHYLAPSPFVELSNPLRKQIESRLDEQKIPWKSGGTWTTDAIWRETEAKVEKYSELGMLAVEMELASLAAVAKSHDIDLAAILCISDLVIGEGWDMGFHETTLAENMKAAMEVAADVLIANHRQT